MSSHTPQQIKEAYARLPQPLKDTIDSEETDNVIFALRKKLGLNIDQLGALSEEVGAVFLGFTRASDFSREIKARLGLDDAKTNEIVKTVDEQIFAKIRTHLQARPTGEEGGKAAPQVSQVKPHAAPIYSNPLTPQTPKPAISVQSPQQTPSPSPVVSPAPSMPMQQTNPLAQKPTVPPTTILEQKLAARVVIPPKENVGGTAPRPAASPKTTTDPYREPIE